MSCLVCRSVVSPRSACVPLTFRLRSDQAPNTNKHQHTHLYTSKNTDNKMHQHNQTHTSVHTNTHQFAPIHINKH